MPSMIPAAIGAGASIFGSLFSGKPKTTTSSSTTTPTFTPQAQGAMDGMSSLSTRLLTDPAAGTEATNLGGIDQINRQYAQMPDQVSQQLAARGFGQSGKLGTAMYNVGSARAGALAGWGGQMADLVSSRQMQGASLADQLAGLGRGSSSTQTTTGPDTSAGNALSSAGNGLSNLSSLLMLQKVLSGNGASSYGSGDNTFSPEG